MEAGNQEPEAKFRWGRYIFWRFESLFKRLVSAATTRTPVHVRTVLLSITAAAPIRV